MNVRQTLFGVCGLATIVALSGCGGSTVVSNSKNPRIRAVDALASSAAVNVTIDGSPIPGVSTFGSSSLYQVFTNGDREVIFKDANTNSTLVDTSPLFRLNSFYTVIGYQSASGPDLLVLSDSGGATSANSSLRFAKVAAGSATVVDVYVTQPGADLTNLQPNFPAVSLGSAAVSYVSFPSGTYEIRETAVGSKTALIDQQMTLNGGTAMTILDDGATAFLSLTDQ